MLTRSIKTLALVGLSVALLAADLSARGVGGGGGGGGNRGGPPGGGGGGAFRGGGGAPHMGGGMAAPRMAGGNIGGGIRAPGGFSAPRGNPGININRSPSFSAPRLPNAAPSAPRIGGVPRTGAPGINASPRIGGVPGGNRLPNAVPNLSRPDRGAGANTPALPNRVNPAPGSRLGDGRLGTPGLGPNVPGLNNPINRNLNQLDRGLNQADRNLNRSLNNLAGQRSANFRPGLNNFPTAARLGNSNINFAANNYRPSYSRYNWYNGFWGGNRGGYWGNGLGWGLGYNRLGYGRFGYGYGYPGYGYGYSGYGYGYSPLGWGLGGWGLGSLLYGSGYLSYYNPYWGPSYGGAGVYNYSQPIPVAYTTPAIVDSPQGDVVPTGIDGAIEAFKAGDYNAALDLVDKAIERTPNDAVLHEFRALVLFARRDYHQAAGTIHSVLAVGPGWDWTTMSNLYDDIDVYTGQLRALEAYTVSHPDDAGAEFLLGYHYLTAGHPKEAKRELETVVRLQPNDKVAADLVRMLSPAPAQGDPNSAGANALPNAPRPEGTVNPQTAQNPQSGNAANTDPFPPTGPAVEPATIAGSWSASRPDGSQFQLRLGPESNFTWTFQNKQEPAQSFDGTYTVSGNVLALERKEGGSMIAELTDAGPQKFHFKLYGSQDDPGLDFTKR